LESFCYQQLPSGNQHANILKCRFDKTVGLEKKRNRQMFRGPLQREGIQTRLEINAEKAQ